MKKVCVVIFLAVAAVACVLFVNLIPQNEGQAESDYLRIHVRANSNSAEDQRVKYEVKDEVVAFITPYVAECTTKREAMRIMKDILPEIESVCKDALEKRGYTYGARANVREEHFPTRVYGELTLEEGDYDALIVELGTGKGDNWWCVIYPPLCFTSATADVRYRSAILDIVKKFFGKS